MHHAGDALSGLVIVHYLLGGPGCQIHRLVWLAGVFKIPRFPVVIEITVLLQALFLTKEIPIIASAL
jgi:hypothetical protein